MDEIEFFILDKCDFCFISRTLFKILANNMTKINPTGNSREEDYIYWLESMTKTLKNPAREIMVIKDLKKIIGYFQYCTDAHTFAMEEIQLSPNYQGQGVFRKLYEFLVPILSDNIEYVTAYVNKMNTKSLAILEHMGLENLGMNKNGNGYNYRGKFIDLKDWLLNSMRMN